MSSGNLELLAQAQCAQQSRSRHQDRSHPRSTSSPNIPPFPKPADSWVEVSSQHSASSASSVPDEVVTHGLKVQSSLDGTSSHPINMSSSRRRKGLLSAATQHRPSLIGRSVSADGSSQEEYEESESDSDRVMTSSNEGAPAFAPSPLSRNDSSAPSEATGEEEDNEDSGEENATALGVASTRNDQNCFTPQPNAFTHPPSSHSKIPEQASGSYFPNARPDGPKPSSRRPSSNLSRKGPTQHSPFNTTSPSHQANHDAALRASLSTLLSCAAAARGLQKPSRQVQAVKQPQDELTDTASRLPPESSPDADNSPPQQRPPRRPSTHSIKSTSSSSRSKRKAPRSASKDRERRAIKRLRVDEAISPTLLTWVVSAGVLVLASALTFSAGYSFGRDQGRIEAWSLSGDGGIGGEIGRTGVGAGECGRQVGKGMGLRRRLWSGAARVVAA